MNEDNESPSGNLPAVRPYAVPPYRETGLRYAIAELHRKAHRTAFAWYIRKGRVPSPLPQILCATTSLDAFIKYNEDEPRIPAGSGPGSGEWTYGGGGDDGNDDKPVDAIYPIYPIEKFLLALLPAGRLLSAWGALAASLASVADGESDSEDVEWTLGNFKSPQRWANQIADRNWTPEEITDTIAAGEQYPAPNYVNPGNTATRYQNIDTGRFVVMDDVTNEILQISGEGFRPLYVP